MPPRHHHAHLVDPRSTLLALAVGLAGCGDPQWGNPGLILSDGSACW